MKLLLLSLISMNAFAFLSPVNSGGGGGGSGSVTSVGFSDASSTPIYSISGSPVTSSGTISETLNTESANKLFCGPTSGGAAQPTFRSVVNGDLPTSGVSAGSYTSSNITVNAQGIVTSAASGSAASPYNVVTKTSNYSASSANFVMANTFNGGFTVTLPAPSVNSYIFIKDSTQSFGGSALTVAPYGSENIDGSSLPLVIRTTDYSAGYISDGVNWFSF